MKEDKVLIRIKIPRETHAKLMYLAKQQGKYLQDFLSETLEKMVKGVAVK
jgi:predicted DNA-binding protein